MSGVGIGFIEQIERNSAIASRTLTKLAKELRSDYSLSSSLEEIKLIKQLYEGSLKIQEITTTISLNAQGTSSSSLEQACYNFLVKEEGFKTQIYYDKYHNATIGIGHLITKGEDFSKGLSVAQVIELFKKDLPIYLRPVQALIKVSLPTPCIVALVSVAYNFGSLDKTLAGFINNQQYLLAIEYWQNILSKGQPILLPRRKREVVLFKKGIGI